jgi:hypothetical protein
VRESLFSITSCGQIRSKAEYDKRPLVADFVAKVEKLNDAENLAKADF